MRRAIPLRLERLSQLYPRLRDPCRDIQAPTAGRPRPTAPLPAPKRNWGAMGLGRARRVGALAALLLLAAAAGRVAAKGGDAARDDDPPLHRQGSDSGARVDAALPQPEAQLKKKLFDGYDKVGDSGMEEGGGWERWQRRWPAPAVRGAGRAARRGARRGRSRGARPCLRFPLTDRARLIATACRRATPGRSTAPPTSLSTSPSTRSGGRGGGGGRQRWGAPGAGRARQRAGLGSGPGSAAPARTLAAAEEIARARAVTPPLGAMAPLAPRRKNQVLGVDLYGGKMTVSVWMRLRWNDPRLTWWVALGGAVCRSRAKGARAPAVARSQLSAPRLKPHRGLLTRNRPRNETETGVNYLYGENIQQDQVCARVRHAARRSCAGDGRASTAPGAALPPPPPPPPRPC
jgi:hypothetical protein